MSYKKGVWQLICRWSGFWGLAAAIMCLISSSTEAADNYWNATLGNWSDTNPSPWSLGAEPTSSDDAYITNGGTATVSQLGETCFYLFLGDANPGTVEMTGGGFSAVSAYVGNSGIGTFNQSAGTTTLSDFLFMGFNSGASGTYNLSGTGQLNANVEWLAGTFNQSGGTHTVLHDLNLRNYASSSGTYNLTGGTLILRYYLGGPQAAAFIFGGGTLQMSGDFTTKFPLTLTGINGNANIDTAGYTAGLFGVLSGTGGLNKLGAGTLTLIAMNSFSGDTVVKGGTLEIVGGIAAGGTSLIDIQSGKAVLKNVSVSKMNLNITNAAAATFEVATGTHVVGAISGSGITQVLSGASLTVGSMRQGGLTIGSNAKVTIQPTVGGPLSGIITSVPEPAGLVLLGIGGLSLLGYAWRRRK